jgi:hypothetical protein
MTTQKLLNIRPAKGEARTEHGEVKVKINLTLTPTAKDFLGDAALDLGFSRSELIERLARKGKAWLVAQAQNSGN